MISPSAAGTWSSSVSTGTAEACRSAAPARSTPSSRQSARRTTRTRRSGCCPAQQQRLRIAQALAGQPRLLLGDEPLLSLDPSSQESVIALLDAYRRGHGTTVVMVTREIPPAAGFFDRVLYVAAGRWAAGAPARW